MLGCKMSVDLNSRIIYEWYASSAAANLQNDDDSIWLLRMSLSQYTIIHLVMDNAFMWIQYKGFSRINLRQYY